MAIYGLICDDSKNKNIEARITWEAEHDYFDQEIRFSATLSLKGKGSFNGKVTGEFSIRGYAKFQSSGKTEISLSNTAWTPVASISETLPYNTSTFGVRGSTAVDGEEDVTFNGIADVGPNRQHVTVSSFSTASEFINASMVVNFLPNGDYMSLGIEVGGKTIRTTYLGRLQTTTTTETIVFTKEELKAIYEAHTETRDCLMKIHLTPYFGEGYSTPQTDKEGTITTTLVIPINEDTMPTADISIIPLNSLKPPYNEKFVKGVTKAEAKFNNAAAKYGAGIVSYELIIGENRYSNPPISTDYLLYSGPMKALAVLTDTRGISVSYESTIEVLDYARPAVVPASGYTRIVCTRCNDDGTLSDSGVALKIIARRQYYPMANTNTCALMYRIAESGTNIEGAAWSTLLDFKDINDDVDKEVSEGSLATNKTYDVEIKAEDSVGDETYVSFFIPTEEVYYHKAISQNSFGIGKYVEEGRTNVIDIDENFDIILRMEQWKETGVDGCKYYRFTGGNHVKVAVNVGITLTDFPKIIATLPKDVRPTKAIYDIVTTTGQEVAGIKIDTAGNVSIEWIYRLGGGLISESEVIVIDGYIDYLIK